MLATGRKVGQPRVVTFGQQSSQFMPVSKIFDLNVFARDRLRCTLSQAGVDAFCQCVGFGPTAVWDLARACSDDAAACPFVRTHPSRKARKRLGHRQRGGVQGAVVPAKSTSASRERGGRFLRDLRDHPSRLVVIPAGCAALAGAVRVANDRALRLFHFHFCLAATCGVSIARSSPRLIPGRC